MIVIQVSFLSLSLSLIHNRGLLNRGHGLFGKLVKIKMVDFENGFVRKLSENELREARQAMVYSPSSSD